MLADLDISLPTGMGLAVYPAGATFGPRHMRDFEFVWVVEGDVEYTCNQTRITVPPGGVVLCRPNTVDTFRWDPVKKTRHAYFHFNVLRTPSDWPPYSEWPLIQIPQDGDILRPLFRHIMTWTGHCDGLLTKLSIAHMLMLFRTGHLGAQEVPHEPMPAAVERVLQHVAKTVAEDPSTPLELAELARVGCVTPEHLCRLFKSFFKCSPVETVRLARLDHAVTLLGHSNYSIGEIARICGFASQFHFARRFKDAYKKTPSELRLYLQAGGVPPTSCLLRVAPALFRDQRRLR